MDQWPGRADEPHRQGGHRPARPFRQPRQLRTHLADDNFARRLKTRNGLTPDDYICKVRTSEPDRFILTPIHQMPGSGTRDDDRTMRADRLVPVRDTRPNLMRRLSALYPLAGPDPTAAVSLLKIFQ